MEEEAKGEGVETAVTEAKVPDEETEKGEEEPVERKGSDEKGKKAEVAKKKNEPNEESDDEKGPAVSEEEAAAAAVEKDTGEGKESPKSQTAKQQKEPAKKVAISSFFGEETFA